MRAYEARTALHVNKRLEGEKSITKYSKRGEPKWKARPAHMPCRSPRPTGQRLYSTPRHTLRSTSQRCTPTRKRLVPAQRSLWRSMCNNGDRAASSSLAYLARPVAQACRSLLPLSFDLPCSSRPTVRLFCKHSFARVVSSPWPTSSTKPVPQPLSRQVYFDDSEKFFPSQPGVLLLFIIALLPVKKTLL